MFKFLKEKLSSVVKKFSKDVEEEAESIEVKEEVKEIKEEHREVAKDVKSSKEKEEKKEQSEEPKQKEEPQKKEKSEQKKKKIPEKKEEKSQRKEIEEKKSEEKRKDSENKKLSKSNSKPEDLEKETKHEKEHKLKSQEKKETPKEKEILDGTLEKESEEEFQEEKEVLTENRPEKKGFFSKLFKKEKKEDDLILKKETPLLEEEVIEQAEERLEEEAEEEIEEKIEKEIEEEFFEEQEEKKEQKKEVPEKTEKKGFFSKITETFTKINLSEEKFEELFWDLEVMLLENNVAVEVIQKIKEDLKKELMSDKISRKNVDEIIKDSLKNSLEEILDIKGFDLQEKIKNKKPYVIAVIGVNGSGKTTTIAKLCHLLQKKGNSVVLAAADTFRAAAIQQLEHHAEKLNVKIIKHDYNSDPAAVAFDAIKHAEAKKIDVVVIDTAGRLHSNDNLMNELKKLIKVNKPDLKLFVGESITGNDCVEQAKVYDEIIGIDAIILSKADIDEKGGAALSISYVTKKPVLFVGTGQTYDDLKPFSKEEIMEGLGF